MKLCHHPNIIRLIDHLENNDYIYIVSEYIEGGTLYDYFKLKKNDFKEKEAANIIRQIAYGIFYLHSYGIVHKDLKPTNIMITEQSDSGIVKIGDFGVSKIISPNECIIETSGTLKYMAPEVVLCRPHGMEIDIWSMGVILYLMIFGVYPFDGENKKQIENSILKKKLWIPHPYFEASSKELDDLIEKCLEKPPEDRITIEELVCHPWFKINEEPEKSP